MCKERICFAIAACNICSFVINFHLFPSYLQLLSAVIRYSQLSSAVHNCHQLSSAVISCHQLSSAVISCHQQFPDSVTHQSPEASSYPGTDGLGQLEGVVVREDGRVDQASGEQEGAGAGAGAGAVAGAGAGDIWGATLIGQLGGQQFDFILLQLAGH